MVEPVTAERPKKKMGRGLKIALICVLVFIVAIAAAAGIYALLFSSAGSRLQVVNVDLSGVADGTYEGSFRLYHDSAEVQVVVKDHRIEKITVMDIPSGLEETYAGLVDDVVREQTLKVDTVTGSTTSQKVVLRAIRDALSGKEQ